MTLHLLHVAGPAWIQDLGRPGRMIEGVPPGGALVPEDLAQANRAVGNRDDAPAIEVFGELVVAARGGDVTIAWEGHATVLPRDHVRRLVPTRAVSYIAVGGGLLAPEVLGGCGLLPTAGLGGLGRPLRAGDLLAVGTDAPTPLPVHLRPPSDAPIRVVLGPDLPEVGPLLVAREWAVAAADRTGCRLAGLPLPTPDSDRALSAPMVRGAIQLPAGGLPVVLGPDHPTTGGYPVVAVVVTPDHGRLALRAPGAPVRFAVVSLAEARDLTGRWRSTFPLGVD